MRWRVVRRFGDNYAGWGEVCGSGEKSETRKTGVVGIEDVRNNYRESRG